MGDSPLHTKSFEFALMIISAYKKLQQDGDYVLSRQMLRSGTAVGALIKESEFAQSRADYINKFSIALKEANETAYWLELLMMSKYINAQNYETFITLNRELISMLVSTIKTLKSKP